MFENGISLNCSIYRALEQLTCPTNNQTAKFRLHKVNGKNSDYLVTFHRQRATSADSCSLWRKFWCYDSEAACCEGIINAVNNKNENDEICFINVASHYSVETPMNNTQWLERANLDVSNTNPQLTLLLDLDDTMFSQYKTDNFTFAYYSSHTRTVYINTDAMMKVAAFKNRGHRVMVVTDATYSFKCIKVAFEHFGIKLNEDYYFNSVHSAKHGMLKRDFISCYAFDKSCLLVDDVDENRSFSTHFYHAVGPRPFPDLLIPENKRKQPQTTSNN